MKQCTNCGTTEEQIWEIDLPTGETTELCTTCTDALFEEEKEEKYFHQKLDELAKLLKALSENDVKNTLAYLTGFFGDKEEEFKFLRVMEEYLKEKI